MSDQPPVLGPTLPVQWPPAPAEQPVPDERAQAARAEAEAVLAEANRMHQQAKTEAARITSAARREADSARAEAQRIRDEAKAAADVKAKRDDKLDTWAARAVIAGAVGLTASGEYALARMAGFDQSVAWLLPFVIDVYVIQAFRRHRDIIQAIALTIAANVTYHLGDAGLFGVRPNGKPEWWMIALVASVASLILWRMHLMVAPPRDRRRWAQRRQQVPETTAVETPAPVTVERVETPAETAQQVSARPALEAGETKPETTGETRPKARETAPRETKAKPRKPRETKKRETASRNVAPMRDAAAEVSLLVDRMRELGGPLTVSIDDAHDLIGRSRATAGRRLETARKEYRKTKNKTAETGS